MSLHTRLKEARFTGGILLRRPFSLLVQVTNRCNMTCSFCDFWPNPAPRGPLTLTHRIPGDGGGRVGSSLFRLDGTDILITVVDGEPLTDILNRVYALGKQEAEEIAVELAGDALRELANDLRG